MREEEYYNVLTKMSHYCVWVKNTYRECPCKHCKIDKYCFDDLGTLTNTEIKHMARALADWENQND